METESGKHFVKNETVRMCRDHASGREGGEDRGRQSKYRIPNKDPPLPSSVP